MNEREIPNRPGRLTVVAAGDLSNADIKAAAERIARSAHISVETAGAAVQEAVATGEVAEAVETGD